MNFFSQSTPVTTIPARNVWLLDVIENRNVLHVGCSDWPLFNPDTNLHLHLQRDGNPRRLDGFDVRDEPGLREQMTGDFHTVRDDVPCGYDVVLIPEVLEHTDRPGDLLAWAKGRGREVVVTVPCWMGYATRWGLNGKLLLETVHPDHVAWYSPSTLRELARRHNMDEGTEYLWINEGTMCGFHWRRI